MGIAVVLYFDHDSEARINQLREKLAQININAAPVESVRPHLTLGAFSDLDLRVLETRMPGFMQGLQVFRLRFSSIGIFNIDQGTIFLAPKVTEDLLILHMHFHGLFKDYRHHGLPYYLPENWVPHCTVAIGLPGERLIQAAGLVYDVFQPFDVNVEQIGIMEFWPVRQTKAYKLNARAGG